MIKPLVRPRRFTIVPIPGYSRHPISIQSEGSAWLHGLPTMAGSPLQLFQPRLDEATVDEWKASTARAVRHHLCYMRLQEAAQAVAGTGEVPRCSTKLAKILQRKARSGMYPTGSLTTDGFALHMTFVRVTDGESGEVLTPSQYQLFRKSVMGRTQVLSWLQHRRFVFGCMAMAGEL